MNLTYLFFSSITDIRFLILFYSLGMFCMLQKVCTKVSPKKQKNMGKGRDREKKFNNRIFHFLHFKEQPTKVTCFPSLLLLCIILIHSSASLLTLTVSLPYHHYFMSILYFFIFNCLSNADVCSTTIHVATSLYSSLSIYINFFR